MVGEAVEAYVFCSYLLIPSAEILVLRLHQSIVSCQRNWRLLAVLKAFCRLDHVSDFSNKTLYIFVFSLCLPFSDANQTVLLKPR